MHIIELYLNSVIENVVKWKKIVMDAHQQSNGYDYGTYGCMFAYWSCFLQETKRLNKAYVDDHGIFTSTLKIMSYYLNSSIFYLLLLRILFLNTLVQITYYRIFIL